MSASGRASREHTSSLRCSLFALMGFFSVLALYGMSVRDSALDEYEKYSQSTLIHSAKDLQNQLGPAIEDLRNAKESDETLKKYNAPPKEALPDAKNLTGTESVWDFLFENADEELIMGTFSQDEESKIPESELNIITLLIKVCEKERADEWLVQLALWFHTVAEAWPKNMELSVRAMEDIENLLRSTYNTSLSQHDVDILEKKEIDLTKKNTGGTVEPVETHLSELDQVIANNITNKVKELLGAPNEIRGPMARVKLQEGLDEELSPPEWQRLLVFTLSVSEALPTMQKYLDQWKSTHFEKVEDVVFEGSPSKKAEDMRAAADLLKIFEAGCEKYPRISALIRSVFMDVLDKEDIDEKEALAKVNSKDTAGRLR